MDIDGKSGQPVHGWCLRCRLTLHGQYVNSSPECISPVLSPEIAIRWELYYTVAVVTTVTLLPVKLVS